MSHSAKDPLHARPLLVKVQRSHSRQAPPDPALNVESLADADRIQMIPLKVPGIRRVNSKMRVWLAGFTTED